MQDRYAGDVGDFGKFYLLKKVFVPTQKNIGIVWYNYDNEEHNADGLHVSYLCSKEYNKNTEEKEIVEKLKIIVQDICNRSIEHIEKQEILPPERTVYFSDKVSFLKEHHKERENLRKSWLDSALKKVKTCEIVFLDPDNGLQIDSVKSFGNKKAGKYAYYDEIIKFFENSKTKVCIVYHHLGRTGGTHKEQIAIRLSELRKKLIKSENKGKDFTIFSIVFRPFSPRVFFIMADNSFLRTNNIELDLKEMRSSREETKQKWDYLFKITSESEKIQYIVDNQT